jgi:26S proteasome regulatory subunit N12
MPAAMSSQSSSLDSVLHNLQQSLSHADASQAQQQLQKAKIALLQQNALIPSQQTPAQTLATARSILEAGALLSIRSRDPQSFIRYYSQLQPFYDFPGLQQHPSKDRSKITGLYLLLLLSQGDYAGFHTLLETLIVAEGANGSAAVEEDPFIKYPVELERSLMEGSYDQVWRKTNGRDVPGEEFGLFSDVRSPVPLLTSTHDADRYLTDPDQHHPCRNCLLRSPILPIPPHCLSEESSLPGLRRRGH